jgi:hypothetical protein
MGWVGSAMASPAGAHYKAPAAIGQPAPYVPSYLAAWTVRVKVAVTSGCSLICTL